MSRVLQVWLLGQHVGQLAQVDGRLNFCYSTQWLQSANARPLSHHLPLQAEAFDDKATRPFFAGLLPEGDKRRLIAQTLHVSRQNDFALLVGIGGECAGAVSLLEPGQRPDLIPSAQAVRWLDEAELIAILNELPRRPMLAGEEGLRLSLAGAQDKLPVVFSEGRLGLPL
ncbi:MAG: HipA N-terminal domain-containing protein, partial [Pseudomonadota bacterium]